MIRQILPPRFDQAEVTANVGKALNLTFVVEDVDGTPLQMSAFGVPPNANFAPETRTLSFTPRMEDRGPFVVRIVASDGCLEASRTLTLVVTENRPPLFSSSPIREIPVGATTQVSLAAHDPDYDSLTYNASSVPERATFDTATAMLTYSPTEDDVGTHAIRVTANDGQRSATQEFTLTVSYSGSSGQQVKREWNSALLPGAGYSLYVPRSHSEWGNFHGVELELLIFAWIHRNDNRGPSHGRVYVNTELLGSTASGVPLLFTYATGFTLSLERNPRRTFLIPNYGLDLGGLIHHGLGTHFQSTPYVSLHLYSNPNLFISARFGYRLVPTQMETLGGWHANISGDFSVW